MLRVIGWNRHSENPPERDHGSVCGRQNRAGSAATRLASTHDRRLIDGAVQRKLAYRSGETLAQCLASSASMPNARRVELGPTAVSASAREGVIGHQPADLCPGAQALYERATSMRAG